MKTQQPHVIWRLLGHCCMILLFTWKAHGQSDESKEKVANPVKVQFHVATDAQMMIESKEAIEARINQTNKIYEPTRLRFELGEILPLPEGILELVTRENRNALAEKVPAPAGVIQVFIVRTAHDVDRINVWITGVHWSYAGRQKSHATRRFIILSSSHSDFDTLAHELGHWFGLVHEKDLMNLMNGTGGRSHTLLTKVQIERLHSHHLAALKRNEIR